MSMSLCRIRSIASISLVKSGLYCRRFAPLHNPQIFDSENDRIVNSSCAKEIQHI